MFFYIGSLFKTFFFLEKKEKRTFQEAIHYSNLNEIS